jgi:hypothetical protein
VTIQLCDRAGYISGKECDILANQQFRLARLRVKRKKIEVKKDKLHPITSHEGPEGE